MVYYHRWLSMVVDRNRRLSTAATSALDCNKLCRTDGRLDLMNNNVGIAIANYRRHRCRRSFSVQTVYLLLLWPPI